METETLVDLLLGESPREAALRTLEWIRAHSQARSVSLWRVVDGSPALELGAAVDEQTIAGVKGLLPRMEGPLGEGQIVRAEGSILVAVDGGSGDGHVLYVDAGYRIMGF